MTKLFGISFTPLRMIRNILWVTESYFTRIFLENSNNLGDLLSRAPLAIEFFLSKVTECTFLLNLYCFKVNEVFNYVEF